jgi:hypothetical protein
VRLSNARSAYFSTLQLFDLPYKSRVLSIETRVSQHEFRDEELKRTQEEDPATEKEHTEEDEPLDGCAVIHSRSKVEVQVQKV